MIENVSNLLTFQNLRFQQILEAQNQNSALFTLIICLLLRKMTSVQFFSFQNTLISTYTKFRAGKANAEYHSYAVTYKITIQNIHLFSGRHTLHK